MGWLIFWIVIGVFFILVGSVALYDIEVEGVFVILLGIVIIVLAVGFYDNSFEHNELISSEVYMYEDYHICITVTEKWDERHPEDIKIVEDKEICWERDEDVEYIEMEGN